MKYLIPVVLAAFVLVGCSKEKAAIDDSNKATQNAINNQKAAVDAAAKADTKQAEVDAEIAKAKIEANKVADQAQLDADKKKADAQAAFEKAKVDAQKQ
jgi:PBP1b-binding outer membrane lipoprotein LpoB